MKCTTRMLCLLFCLSFLLTTADITINLAYAAENLYSQNFEGTNLTQSQVPYVNTDGESYSLPCVSGGGFECFSGSNFGTSLVQDPFNEDNNVFLWQRYSNRKYPASANDTNCYIRMSNNDIKDPTSGYLDVSFRIYLPRQPQTNHMQVRLGGNTSWSRTVELTFISTETAGMTCSVRGRKETYTDNNYWRDLQLTSVADLNDDGWNNVRIIQDYNEQKSHLLINGKLVCADIPHGNNVATGLIALYFISSEDSIPTTAYIDDITISDITEPEIANAIFDGAEACLSGLSYRANPDSLDAFFSNQGNLPTSAALSSQTTSFSWGNPVSGKTYYETAAGSTGKKSDLRITPPAEPQNDSYAYCTVYGYAPRYYSSNFCYDGTHILTPKVTVGDTTITKPVKHEITVYRQLLETTDPKIEIGVPKIIGGHWMTPNCSAKEVDVPAVLTAVKNSSDTHIWQSVRVKNTDSRERKISLGVLYYQNGSLLENNKLTRFIITSIPAGEEYQWNPNVAKDHIPYNDLATLTIKFIAFDVENLQPLLPHVPAIGLTDGVTGSLNASKTKLTLSGKGEVAALSDFSEAAWATGADTVTEIEVGGGITAIGANTLSGFTALEKIRFPESVATISEGALPTGSDYTITGYKNSAAEVYASNHGNPFLLSGLRVLSIGNSHTADYSAFRDIIRNDLKAAGLITDIEMTSIVYGGRKLYMTDTLATNPPHLNAIVAGTYNKYLTGDTWDLIIIQDWHEASRKDANFVSGIGKVIEAIKAKQPDAKIAWTMDWAEKSTIIDGYGADLDAVYQNIVDTVTDVEAMTENAPDYIIPMGTAIQNARTSYLGSTNNAYGCYVNASDTDYASQTLHTFSVFERDSTHMSLELGRYTAGTAVFQKLIDIYGHELDKVSDFNFATALQTAPDSSKSAGKAAWEGTFTESIWNIVTESARNAVEQPKQVTPSIHTADPATAFKSAIENANYSLDWNTASNTEIISAVKAQASLPVDVFISADDVEKTATEVRITFLYGYTSLTAVIPIL